MRRIAVACAALLAPSAASAAELPFHRSTLDNGLTLIVHEDRSVPVAAVNLVVRVGSRDEERGKTGFAHLFEHLMFMGTRRVPPKMFDAWMEAAGGSNNAWTSADLTDYHETAPPGALGLLLYLEADRLEVLGREIDQAKLDLQRDVVRNERRQQIENVPYGKVELRLPELLYPAGHPYHHPVIGSHEDLEAATVADVRRFFATHYAAANVSLVVAGDVRVDEVRAQVERLFGRLPGGARPARARAGEVPRLPSQVRETLEDKVELAKLTVAYHTPAHFAPDDAELDLFASVACSGKASRLYRALVVDRPLAQSVDCSQQSAQLSSVFQLEIVARAGVSLGEVEAALDSALRGAIDAPPSAAELRRARSQYEHAFVARLEAPAARAKLLNLYEVELGDPGSLDRDLARYRDATREGVARAARTWLGVSGRVVLGVVPAKGRAK
ncbi:MAG: insulinase family protein [Polyangiaceae bacterium]|nr:insulinase family protein [Polyangiaceae bacterium]